MRFRTMTRLGLALALGLGLAACGSQRNEVFELVKALPASFGKKGEGGAAGVTADQMNAMLQATQAPVALFQFEARGAQFMMIDIQRNGPYQSFASSDRRSIIMRRGMITATRGFGGDLMTSEEEALLSMVSRRQEGATPYVQRLLTAEDVTETKSYSCDVTRGGPQKIALGEVNTTGTVMDAVCRGEGVKFENKFIVASDGYILSARQWLGFGIGYVATQAVRR